MKLKRILSVSVCIILTLTACVPNKNALTAQQTPDNADVSEVSMTDVLTSKNAESHTASSSVSSSASSSCELSSSRVTSKAASSARAAESKSASSASSAVSSKQENTSDIASESSGSTAPPYYTPYRFEEYFASPEYSAALYCVEDHEFLLSENMDHHSSPASITKLVTACVASRYLMEDDIVEVGLEQCLVTHGLTLCGLNIGTKLTVKELMYGMLLPSGADAAYTFAVSAARKAYPDENLGDTEAVDRFVEMMNDFVRSIGMNDSHFVSPEGRDYAEQYVTAHDLMLLGEYALSVPMIREVVGTFRYGLPGTGIVWTSTNRLLNAYDVCYNRNAIGLKTGTTSSAGYCLLSAFSYNGKTYISAVLGAGPDVYEVTLSHVSEFVEGVSKIGGGKTDSEPASSPETDNESNTSNDTENTADSRPGEEIESAADSTDEENGIE